MTKHGSTSMRKNSKWLMPSKDDTLQVAKMKTIINLKEDPSSTERYERYLIGVQDPENVDSMFLRLKKVLSWTTSRIKNLKY